MKHVLASSLVTIVALLAATAVDISGHDSAPYIGVAILSLGYAVGSGVNTPRKSKP